MTVTADALPILEQARLDALAAELDSRTDALDFAATFLHLLPRRIGAIAKTVAAGHAEAAHVALVSLASSAGTVGALQLEHDARHADQEIRAGHFSDARAAIPLLDRDAEAVAHALQELLGHA
ncbi:hypothetical protein SPF06_09210 [Sinomonas sp. JGH33]|uniref:HPt domain-containing protein n=1 Tax=Sinomonas terricola TaxID=3110330 RepID=A0ABU5T5G1_9MICC|nr:hypothetical protein [Sinomonas sp. JGH33]MEA5454899.1 hypothetical protein [Sinomonas sp. JGH33]